jgi:hypothetical protein
VVDEDFETMEGPTGPSPARWYVLVAVVLLNLVLTLFRSSMPTGYTLGVATAPLVWGLVFGLVVWLVRGRKLAAFAGAFFWVTLVSTCLSLVKVALP